MVNFMLCVFYRIFKDKFFIALKRNHRPKYKNKNQISFKKDKPL